ncbi:uncharacterized protein A1O9_04491, partial [Exophiala aquamarina CBS 119918]
QRSQKISTACGACKQRKTRCTGGQPCDACGTRRTPCVYNASSDQRRKIANQRNVHDLAESQVNLKRHQQLLGGIIATLKAGDDESTRDLIRVIRSGVDLSQVAAHVRNECRANVEIQHAYDEIIFHIDGPLELPSPTQLLSEIPLNEDSHFPESIGSESSEKNASMAS